MNDTSHNSSGGSEHQIQFKSAEEEIKFLRKKLDETQTEFLEFQESSRELELEYETQVEQLEKKNNDYLNQLAKLEIENDQLKSKYSIYANETQHKLNEYQEQIAGLQALNTRLSSYIRELEQNNDDLERARRALAASLEDFECQLNQQIERNVLLENEVTEKEELECIVQRLKEESRDLKHELIAKRSEASKKKQQMIDSCLALKSPTDTSSLSLTNQSHLDDNENDKENHQNDQLKGEIAAGAAASAAQTGPAKTESSLYRSSPSNIKPSMVDSTTSPPTTPHTHFSFSPNSHQSSSDSSSSKITDSKSQQTSNPPSPTMPAMVMSPSSRISALNIVSDLLRKVLSLESKLSTAKKVTTE
uniref:Nuclear distribution protein nudE 1 n=1 Tax=Aceria tosichella TaxID=561515 RepID=A0A6G1SFU1_9ACAR